MPKYDEKEEMVLHKELTDQGLPITQVPILCTFGKLNGSLFLDPTTREESILDARMSISTIENGNICAMQKGETGTFTEQEVLNLVELAIKKGAELRKNIK